jgi:EAL domain-containing protein (putative c-di-GMP-specific phosphodiesterase class I)/GGDEF domain-containing protein
MLHSELEERGRRFSLALRAGIPVLLLVFLVFYTTLEHTEKITITLQDGILIAAITFITIYFIYFFINLSVQETMLDETTHGFNKKAFVKKLHEHKPKTIACLTITNLHSLNRNYSSDQIDTVLYTLTQRLNLIFTQHGLNKVLIGRDRGSEFIIALNEKNLALESILEVITDENKRIDNIEIAYAFSIITNTSNHYEKIITQLRDLIHTPSNSSIEIESIKDAKELSDIETSVIEAIQNKNLLLSFRPVLNTFNDTIDIYEIAVKLKSNTQKDILPRQFLPIINRLGLGRKYDMMLITHVIDLLPLVDESISFTFNISPFSLRDETFKENVFHDIQEKGINTSRLIIQLYERKTHHDLSSYLKTLKDFRAQGIRICIDNFGSSNASMEYMKHFKFDMVQFDRDYVTHLENKTTYAMLDSLVKMSHELDIKTVAKWVDNETQKKALKTLGIQYIQGFGISKPITENTLINKYN